MRSLGRGCKLWGVSCSPQTTRTATAPSASYKTRAYARPYERFGSLIAKSDRFPSIGPFVVTSDGNRFCCARIAACQSSSFRGRCWERTRYRDAMRSHWQMGLRPLGNEWWLRCMIAIMLTSLSAMLAFNIRPLGHKLFLLLSYRPFAFGSVKFPDYEMFDFIYSVVIFQLSSERNNILLYRSLNINEKFLKI